MRFICYRINCGGIVYYTVDDRHGCVSSDRFDSAVIAGPYSMKFVLSALWQVNKDYLLCVTLPAKKTALHPGGGAPWIGASFCVRLEQPLSEQQG